MKIRKNYSLKKFTSIQIGGPAKFFTVVKSETELIHAIKFARKQNVPWYLVGAGSNLVVSDEGYGGLIIANHIQKLDRLNENTISVGAGNNLMKSINLFNALGLRGLERMAGIPGTVGGAVYGCAGAYGQEIRDCLSEVKIFDSQKIRILPKTACEFGYRSSIFKKHKNWVILEVIFKFQKSKPKELQKISQEIVKLRLVKYPKGLKCPGSFFQNIKLDDLPSKKIRDGLVRQLPHDKIMHGKVPTGFLLENIGAKGMKQGQIFVARHHGNLIYNSGDGQAQDIKKMADKLKILVKKKYGVTIQEEVQYVGFLKKVKGN